MEIALTRRGLLKGILAASIAPAVIGIDRLMPVRSIITHQPLAILWGDGIHDDTAALQNLLDGKDVFSARSGIKMSALEDGIIKLNVYGEVYRLERGLTLSKRTHIVGGHFKFPDNFKGAMFTIPIDKNIPSIARSDNIICNAGYSSLPTKISQNEIHLNKNHAHSSSLSSGYRPFDNTRGGYNRNKRRI